MKTLRWHPAPRGEGYPKGKAGAQEWRDRGGPKASGELLEQKYAKDLGKKKRGTKDSRGRYPERKEKRNHDIRVADRKKVDDSQPHFGKVPD